MSAPLRSEGASVDDPDSTAAGFSRRCLRSVLAAASRPGTIVTVDAAQQTANSVSVAALAACSGLLGVDSRFWLSTDLRRNRNLLAALRFLCGAESCASSRDAAFALMNGHEWDRPERFRYGDDVSPYSSTTVIIEVEALFPNGEFAIHCDLDDTRSAAAIGVRGISGRFWQDVNRNYRRAPCGLDFLLTCTNRIVAITRQCCVSPVQRCESRSARR